MSPVTVCPKPTSKEWKLGPDTGSTAIRNESEAYLEGMKTLDKYFDRYAGRGSPKPTSKEWKQKGIVKVIHRLHSPKPTSKEWKPR